MKTSRHTKSASLSICKTWKDTSPKSKIGHSLNAQHRTDRYYFTLASILLITVSSRFGTDLYKFWHTSVFKHPGFFQRGFQIIRGFGKWLKFTDKCFYEMDVFDHIEIRIFRWPWTHNDCLNEQKFLHDFGSMYWIIALLKHFVMVDFLEKRDKVFSHELIWPFTLTRNAHVLHHDATVFIDNVTCETSTS